MLHGLILDCTQLRFDGVGVDLYFWQLGRQDIRAKISQLRVNAQTGLGRFQCYPSRSML